MVAKCRREVRGLIPQRGEADPPEQCPVQFGALGYLAAPKKVEVRQGPSRVEVRAQFRKDLGWPPFPGQGLVHAVGPRRPLDRGLFQHIANRARSDFQTGPCGLTEHPQEGRAPQAALDFGIAAADIAVDSRKPHFAHILAPFLRLRPSILSEEGAAFIQGNGLSHDFDTGIARGVGITDGFPNPAQRRNGVPEAEEPDVDGARVALRG